MRFPAWIPRREQRPVRGAILMYHRIANPAGRLSNLAVSPQNFAAHLDVLAETCTVLPMSGLVDGLKRGRLPERAAVITFDDGYADNLRQAEPILRLRSMPATIYIITNFIGQKGRFWWDVINLALAKGGRASSELSLEANGEAHTWHMSSAEEKEAAYAEIIRLVRLLEPAQIAQIVEAVVDWAGELEDNAADYPMDEGELREIEAGGAVRLGAHTCSHPVLDALGYAAQQAEIVESRRRLEAILRRRVEDFSYPFGRHNQDSLKIVRRERFRSAVSTRNAPVTENDTPFSLPRFPVEDWDREAFAARLDALFAMDLNR